MLSERSKERGLTFFGGYDFHVKETVTVSLSFISSPCLRCVFYSILSTRDQIIAFTGFSNHPSKFLTKPENINHIGFTDRQQTVVNSSY